MNIKKKTYPKIPEYFNVFNISNNKLFFKSTEDFLSIEGDSVPIIMKLIPYFIGKFDLSEIEQKTGISIDKIETIIQILSEKKLIFYEKETAIPDIKKNMDQFHNQATLFLSRSLNYSKRYEAIKQVQNSSIILLNLGAVGSHVLASLMSFGIRRIIVIDNEIITESDIELGSPLLYSRKDIGNSRGKTVKEKIDSNCLDNCIEFRFENLKEIDEKHILDVDFTIFCADTASPKEHNLINLLCLQRKKSWISVRYLGDFGEVGPLVTPYKSPCFKCYEYRIKSNLDYTDEQMAFQKYLETNKERYCGLRMFYEILASYASTEVIKHLAGIQTNTRGHVLSINFKNYESELHPILKIPNCSACENEI